jgi:WD40 repeat protein
MNQVASPFVGIVPYDAESRRYFCGRDREVELITANATSSRLTVFYGMTGAGKSSILCAGLIPWLKETRTAKVASTPATPYRPVPVLLREQWSLDPWVELGRAVAKAMEDWPEYRNCAFPGAWFSPPSDGVRDGQTLGAKSISTQAAALRPPRLILILDQFEELFIQHPDLGATPSAVLLKMAEDWSRGEIPSVASPSQMLAACLIALLNDGAAPVNIIFSLREDCLASLDTFKGLIPDLFGTMLRIDPLDARAVETVITESLARWGKDHGLADAFRPEMPDSSATPPHDGLIAEVIKDEALWIRDPARPDRKDSQYRRYETLFLQLALEKLWNRDIGEAKAYSGGTLTVATYRALGGAAGTRRSFVDASLNENLPSRSIEQRWFLEATRQLVSRTKKFPWRVSDLVVEMKDALERDGISAPTEAQMIALLSRFLDDKIIRKLSYEGADAQSPRFEVAHDALAGDIYRWRVEQQTILDRQRELQEEEKRQKERMDIQQIEEDKASIRIRDAEEREKKLKSAFRATRNMGFVMTMLLLSVAIYLTIKTTLANKQADLAAAAVEAAASKEAEAESRVREANARASEATSFVEKLRGAESELVKIKSENDKLKRVSRDIVSDVMFVQENARDDAAFNQAVTRLRTNTGSLHDIVSNTSTQVDAATIAVKDLTSTVRLPAVVVFPVQPESITDLKFLPTSPPLLAAGSMGKASEGSLRLYDFDGKAVRKFPGDCARISVSPDGNWLVALPWAKNLIRVYTRNGEWKDAKLGAGPGNAYTATFSPDGKLLAVGWENSVQIWDWQSPPAQSPSWQDNTALTKPVTSVAFSPDRRYLVAGCDDNYFCAYLLPTASFHADGVTIFRKETVHAPLRAPVYSADGRWLLVPNGSPSAWLYPGDAQEGSGIQLKHEKNVVTGDISPDNRWIAILTTDGRTHFWRLDAAADPVVSRAGSGGGSNGVPRTLAWRPGSGSLAVAGDDGAVLIWEPDFIKQGAKNIPAMTLGGHRKSVRTLEYSADGRYLASGDDGGVVRLWDFQDLRTWQKGRLGTFGGPDDPKLNADEELALVRSWLEVDRLAMKQLFLSSADHTAPPKARQLDPQQYYIAMRWDYKSTPVAWLQSHTVKVMNLRTGVEKEARPVDFGPGLSTGLLMHISPALAKDLGLNEDDEAACWVPTPAPEPTTK